MKTTEEKKVIMIDEVSISYRSDGTIVYDTDEPTDDYAKVARKMARIIHGAIKMKEAHEGALSAGESGALAGEIVNAFTGGILLER